VRLRTAIGVGLPLAVAVGVIYFFIYAGPHLRSTWVTEKTSPLLVFYIFMPGVAFAAIETFLPERVERFGRRHTRLAWVIPTVAALGSFTVLYCNQWFDPRDPQVSAWLIFVGISGVLGASLLLQWGTGGCWRLLDNRVFRWLGQRSYSIYMVHLAIVVELAPRLARALGDNYKQTFVALVAASILASVVLGEVVFRLVEAPFMNLKTSGWRSSGRAAVFRRAAWWLPSRALERMRGRRPVAEGAQAAESVPESAVGAEPSASQVSPSGS
jgi:peptidoglycan/LPS O-acetylase OafA/YrhL